VVAVALCGHSGLNSIAHQNIYFYLFSFFGWKIEKPHASLQKVDVLPLLVLTPWGWGDFDFSFFWSLQGLQD
jgi:hypothetical protein